MQNDLKKVEEEIRQYKLYKIQIAESKIREYEKLYALIKEHIVIKFTKNTFSNILRVILILSAIVFFTLAFMFIFPEFAISIFEKQEGLLSQDKREQLFKIAPFLGYILLLAGLVLSFISFLLRKNNHKRTTIYKLSGLMDEVIDYMNKDVREEKKKYEYFVESIAEIEVRKNNRNKNTN